MMRLRMKLGACSEALLAVRASAVLAADVLAFAVLASRMYGVERRRRPGLGAAPLPAAECAHLSPAAQHFAG